MREDVPTAADLGLQMLQERRETLEKELLHAIVMERKAGTRVKRAATTLHKWQSTRRLIEKRIGTEEVRRIVNRLTTTGGENNEAK